MGGNARDRGTIASARRSAESIHRLSAAAARWGGLTRGPSRARKALASAKALCARILVNGAPKDRRALSRRRAARAPSPVLQLGARRTRRNCVQPRINRSMFPPARFRPIRRARGGRTQRCPLIHQPQGEAPAAHRFHAHAEQALADQPWAQLRIHGHLSQSLRREPLNGIYGTRFFKGHVSFYPTRPYCSACPTQRRMSGSTCSGHSRSMVSAAICTLGSKSASRNKSATRICARPV